MSYFLTRWQVADGAEYRDISYHTDVRWLRLSRGKVLKRFVELRKEICEFLTDKGEVTALFTNKQWLSYSAFKPWLLIKKQQYSIGLYYVIISVVVFR